MPDKPPAPVEVVNPDPLAVTMDANGPPIPVSVHATPDTTAESDARAQLAAALSSEEALTTEGQRGINRLWERTQAIIAIAVVTTTLFVVSMVIVTPLFKDDPNDVLLTAAAAGLVLLSNLVGNVTGFYFSRTNHQKIGGVGSDRISGR